MQEFFKNNPAKEVRKLLAHWIADTVKKVSVEKKQRFLDAMIAYMAINAENFSDFCQILFELMSADRGLIEYASKKNISGILLENVLAKEKPVFKNL